MGVPQIVREYINGAWRTTEVKSGSSGPVTSGDIDSGAATNGEVLTADGTGGADWEPGGGSQPISSPLDLTGCVLWLDASALPAGALALWPDGSPSSFDAAQATADNQPVVVAAVQNGLSVVRFDPTSFPQLVAFSGLALGLFNGLDGFTIAGISGNVTGGNDYLLEASKGTDATVPRISWETYINFFMDDEDGVGFNTSGASFSPAGANAGEILGASLVAVDCVRGIVTGSSSPSSTAAPLAGAIYTPNQPGLPATDSLAMQIGADLSANGADCDLGELIVYDRALNASEQRQVLEYLSAKWATL